MKYPCTTLAVLAAVLAAVGCQQQAPEELACRDQCTVDATRCSGTGVATCRTMASGCTDWDAPAACAGVREVCSGGTCLATCSDQCTVGAARCSGTGVATCKTMATGCTDWDTPAACTAAHEVCSGGACAAACVDQCTVGAARCSGTGVATCKTMATGCTDWDTPAACAGAHEVCSGGACTATCADQCTVGATSCSGTGVATCKTMATGCTDWDTPAACAGAHEVCSGGACTATCIDQCTVGATSCSGTGVATCKTMATGCTDWDTPAACTGAHEVCSGGACAATCSDQCTFGAVRCAGSITQTCTTQPSGCTDWAAPEACPGVNQVCSGAGVCILDPTASAKEITSFQFLSADNRGQFADVTATILGHNIIATVPAGTNASSSLIARFVTTGIRVKVGDVLEVSGVSSASFMNPVRYTVTAADGTTQDYIVSMTEQAPAPVVSQPGTCILQGTAQPLSQLRVIDSRSQRGVTFQVDVNGAFSGNLVCDPGDVLQIRSVGGAAFQLPKVSPWVFVTIPGTDVVGPVAPASIASHIDGNNFVVTGTAEVFGSVQLVNLSSGDSPAIGPVVVDPAGTGAGLFEVSIPALGGDWIQVAALDAAGNPSPRVTLQVPGPDARPPLPPRNFGVFRTGAHCGVSALAEPFAQLTATNVSASADINVRLAADADGRWISSSSAGPCRPGDVLEIGVGEATPDVMTVVPGIDTSPPLAPFVISSTWLDAVIEIHASTEPLGKLVVVNQRQPLPQTEYTADGGVFGAATVQVPALPGDELIVSAQDAAGLRTGIVWVAPPRF